MQIALYVDVLAYQIASTTMLERLGAREASFVAYLLAVIFFCIPRIGHSALSRVYASPSIHDETVAMTRFVFSTLTYLSMYQRVPIHPVFLLALGSFCLHETTSLREDWFLHQMAFLCVCFEVVKLCVRAVERYRLKPAAMFVLALCYVEIAVLVTLALGDIYTTKEQHWVVWTFVVFCPPHILVLSNIMQLTVVPPLYASTHVDLMGDLLPPPSNLAGLTDSSAPEDIMGVFMSPPLQLEVVQHSEDMITFG